MIFVTGGNGLVGSFIVRKFLQAGFAVRCLSRPNSDLSLLEDVKHEIDWVLGDVLDVKNIEKYLEGVDTIIHCAAIISFQKSRYDEMYKINVEGTRTLVDVALAANVKYFGYISSIAAIGRNKNNSIVDESNMWEDSPSNTGYAKTKYLAELEVWRGMEEGLQGFIVNPSVVIGAGNWEHGSTKIFRYAYQEHHFFPQGNINYVDVKDVAEVVYRLYNDKIFGQRFILNGGNETYKNFLTKVARSFGKKPPKVKAGTILAFIAFILDSTRHIVTGKEPLLTNETLRMSRESYSYDSSQITKVLNFNFQDLDSSIDAISKSLKERFVNK
ncbi:MAG TPA: NAD-dependent epimerase/dehydratase family protein [Cytophagaceae bacterium]|jgi:nucleoside-diphosphate-sugar epimerase